MKLKKFSGLKKCKSGETYIFKNGLAKVPGLKHFRREVLITLAEFKELDK